MSSDIHQNKPTGESPNRTQALPPLGAATLTDLLEASPDAMIISDEAGRIVFVNLQAERLFGYTREQLLQQSVEMLIPEQFRAAHAVRRKEFLQQPHTRLMGIGLELVVQRADATALQVEISLGVLRTGEGTLVCSAIRDLTDRKRAESDLKRTAADLARSNAELKEFLYAVSHDLQEPLRTVIGSTQVLTRDYTEKLEPEIREWVGFAVEGAKRMQELINALVNYTNLGTERQPFELVDCEEVYQAAVANLKMAIEESGAELSHSPLPVVMGDRVQLVQLFQNLLANAVKFRHQTSPKVQVSADDQGEQWRVAVRDNGIGIDPKHFHRLFVLFQRLHSRKEYSGTGIGLAVCKKIVGLHGGQIGVESLPGQGSTFYFTIPKVDHSCLPVLPNSVGRSP